MIASKPQHDVIRDGRARANVSAGLRAASIAVLLAAGTLVLYARQLDRAPIYLAHDEVDVAVEGYSVASTGRSTSGQHLPLYFQTPAFAAGRDPLSIYLTAVVLKARPLSEAAIRFPSVLIGTLNVVLLFFVGRELFGRDGLAVVAAAALALAPAHFIHSRMALNVVFPLPFVELWLLCLIVAIRRGSEWWSAAAGLVLGLGVYSYVAALLMMPLYLVISLLVLWASGALSTRRAAMLLGAFGLALVPLVVWQIGHPARLQQLAGYYRLYDATKLNALQGARDLSSYFSLAVRSDVYWRFFSPGFLFFSGDSSVMNSTREAGVFSLALLVLLPLGMARIVATRRPVPLAILAGFVSGPIAAVLVAEIAIHRAMFLLPFGALVAAFGAEHLLSRGGWRRWLGVLLVAAIPLQFARFAADYFGDYRIRSIPWFDNNVRGALADVVARAPAGHAPEVYLSADIPFVDRYWMLYVTQWGRPDLLGRPVYPETRHMDVSRMPHGSLVLLYTSDLSRSELLKAGGLRVTPAGVEPNGTSAFSLLEKN
jgi:4-amino-4-deoxy-L-arabinose transferase-like glycosyltransferase